MQLTHWIVQNAYVVDDLDAAVDQWHAALGLGPFFMRRHLCLDRVLYRGRPARLDFSAAYVQAGPIMIELVQQHDDEPSAFRDMFARGQHGLHHVAIVPDDYEACVAGFGGLGCPVVTEMHARAGRGAALVDTRALLGHMTEVYFPTSGLQRLYAEVAQAARQWDGRQLRIEVDPAT
jgi:hypothetical protein